MRYELVKICPDDERINNLMREQAESGFIVITAYGGGDTDPLIVHSQKLKNRKLKADIKAAKYFFIPIWGIFNETDEYGTHFELEQAFIVFNYHRDNERKPEHLRLLGQEWCTRAEQEAFIYREAGMDGIAHLVTASGTIEKSFDPISPTAAANLYFETLNKSAVSRLQDKALSYSGSRMYVAQSPNSLNEAMMRSGEIYYRFYEKC